MSGRALPACSSRKERTTKKDVPYLVLELGKGTGREETGIWSVSVKDWTDLSTGVPVSADAEVIDGWQGLRRSCPSARDSA